MKQIFHLRVNGQDAEVHIPVHKTLLEVFHEELTLTGTQHGCEQGECGACTVLVDGEPILACVALPIKIRGREIATIEGRPNGAPSHPLQATFAELGVTQCDYCTPGILRAAKR